MQHHQQQEHQQQEHHQQHHQHHHHNQQPQNDEQQPKPKPRQRLATPADAMAIARVPSQCFVSIAPCGSGAFGDVDVVRVPVAATQRGGGGGDGGGADADHLVLVRKRLRRGPDAPLGAADWAREAAAHRLAAGSPFVLRLLAARRCRTDGLLLLTEYHAAGSLADVLRRHRRLDEAAVRFVAACALLALDHLHVRRVLHRDLKPCNLLLCSRTGYVSVADLGCAVVLPEGQDAAFARAGSCGYRAPEVGSGRPYNARADFYGLGMTLFELAAGRLPPWAAAAKARREAQLAAERRQQQGHQQQQQQEQLQEQQQQEPEQQQQEQHQAEPAAADGAQQPEQLPEQRPLEWPAHFSPSLVELLASLLAHDAAARPASAAAIKSAAFFVGFDFDALKERTLPSPALRLAQGGGAGVAVALA